MSKTLILGASTSMYRYSYLCAISLLNKNEELVLVGKSGGEIEGNKILKSWPENLEVDTITVYLSAQHQKKYYEDFLNSKVKRVIFNPGAENAELENLLNEKGIATERACTLVLISTSQY